MAAHNIRRLVEVFRFTIGTLRSDGDGDGNKNVKKSNGKISKTTMHVRHVFLVHFYAVTTRPRLQKAQFHVI